MIIDPKIDRARLYYPHKERQLYTLGLSGHKQEKLTLAKLHKHLTGGEVEGAVLGSDGNQHSSGNVISKTVRGPDKEEFASSVLSPSNTRCRRDRLLDSHIKSACSGKGVPQMKGV